MLFLGCDAGSTKFAYAIANDAGSLLAYRRFPGINVLESGVGAFETGLASHIAQTLEAAGVQAADITCAAFGLTGYGESKTSHEDMSRAVQGALGHDRFLLANDSVVGWSGALECQPGIAVVSGTGSVAYGEDGHGGAARAGGWSIRFGDEGSSYWVAAQAINAFFRQADGRMSRTLLYDRFMALFGIDDPLHMPMELHNMLHEEIPAIAGFQREVLRLYEAGDPCAKDIYIRAAQELCALVSGLMHTLSFGDGPVKVSYSGGLFKAGACIQEPFVEAVRALGAEPVAPAYSPIVGAVGYAARPSLSTPALSHLFASVAAAIDQEENR